jgi:hypothetical protein
LNEEILGRDDVYRQSMPRNRGRGGRGKNIINGLKKQEKIKSLVLSFRRQF